MRKALSRIGNHISSAIGKAIGDYDLIDKGDRILVAVSGGKDSLTLLKLLKVRQEWSPVNYELVAAHITTDFMSRSSAHEDILKKIFKEAAVPYRFRRIKVLDTKKRTNCFWCSWNRRKALFLMADRLGCNKIAFGHNKDDIIETTLLNLFFRGEFSTMNPRQELFKGKIIIIRPLCYVEERYTRQFARESGFPADLCACPFGKDSNRRLMKELVTDLVKRCPDLKTNIFRSIARVKKGYIDITEEDLVAPKR